jgi:soluble lytic murein transglycosylase-like protein
MRIRRRWIIIVCCVVIVAGLIAGAVSWFLPRQRETREASAPPPKPEAPPDLAKLRPVFVAGVEAVLRGDGAEGVKQLSSFSFKQRAAEEYRLYYLAKAHALAKNGGAARLTYAQLWARKPKMVAWPDAGNALVAIYADAADHASSATVADGIAARDADSATAAAARWSALNSHLAQGDVASVLDIARNLAMKNPTTKQASDAIAVVRSLTGLAPTDAIRLTPTERMERAVSLLRDGDPQDALTEFDALEASGLPDHLRQPLQLNRGLALNQLHRFEDSNRVLEPLDAGPYKVAIPALYTASKNYRVLSASINPNVSKVITVRQQVGVTKRAVGKGKKRRVITKPKFGNVKKTIQLVDLAKKAKKEEYDRLGTERLKDMLSLPLAPEVRVEVLNTLIALAEAKNQDAYERQLITDLAKVDPAQEAGLQHFWDKAWAAYARGDLNGARDLLTFIRDVYRNPNVKRQAQYWLARSAERLGNKAEAQQAYQELASAPYDDIYAIAAERRGAKRQAIDVNPLKMNRADWSDIAEHNMPDELRLAYELTALSDGRDARMEIQKNLKHGNEQFANALLADLYNSTGNAILMLKALRAAFPAVATVEQDSVPPYFLKMYYPLKFESEIRKHAEKNGLDPYLVMGLIHQESFFNPRAKSWVGATGLMQLMPATGKELAGRLGISPRLDNPETNIRLGTAHFKMLVNMFSGDTDLAIASYNAGQGRVLQWKRGFGGKPHDEFLESIPFRETRTYVKHVVMLGSTYRRMYPK